MAGANKVHKPAWYEGPPFKRLVGGIKGIPGPYKKSKTYPSDEHPGGSGAVGLVGEKTHLNKS